MGFFFAAIEKVLIALFILVAAAIVCFLLMGLVLMGFGVFLLVSAGGEHGLAYLLGGVFVLVVAFVLIIGFDDDDDD